jgi:hypothetical protein
MAKDQEEFRESWMAVSKILDENESVPTGFTDYCREATAATNACIALPQVGII